MAEGRPVQVSPSSLALISTLSSGVDVEEGGGGGDKEDTEKNEKRQYEEETQIRNTEKTANQSM